MHTASRSDVLRFRFRRHELDRDAGTADGPDDVALLDLGVQDTGPDGSGWALAIRGLAPEDHGDGVALAWTLRGAPHAYRRADLPAVAVATAPLSEADAAKRIFDAAKPLHAAGIPVLDALRTVAGHLRDIAARPTVKGDVSSQLTGLLGEPYLRWCQPCATTHIYEQPFRLSALQAGLELEAGTSPPVLRRIPRLRPPMFTRPGSDAEPRFDVVRTHLRYFGPQRPRDVAGALDAPLKEVKAHWPDDAVEVTVAGVDERRGRRPEPRYVLDEDLDELAAGGTANGARTLRLVGPYDPYLQGRDRELLVADEARRKELWPVLGRPGAILADGEVIGTWRPRSSGRRLTIRVQEWSPLTAADQRRVEAEAERLAAHRGVTLAGLTEG